MVRIKPYCIFNQWLSFRLEIGVEPVGLCTYDATEVSNRDMTTQAFLWFDYFLVLILRNFSSGVQCLMVFVPLQVLCSGLGFPRTIYP